MDVVDMIMDDHREVERLFNELKNNPDKRPLLTPVMCALLVAHSRAEESEVYPVAKKEAGETDEVEHSQQEHAEAEKLLAELAQADPTGSRYEQLLDKVIESVTHHVEEEESTVLPGMRSRLDGDRLSQLAKAFASSRAQHLGEMPGQATKGELLQQARNAGISGASSMSREQLTKALQTQSS
ncbi:hemerythrin domain-containing protein [Kibdelosporangium aridum]|uniref:Hemerythrin HHE cation binding domain-containing protein n=1 Tax=Kibdelosporangium aridum TaxID=2030 RepID=A0A1W2F9C2_KIBAR|nr:hemerythrin domain-containing protein [Kibdelosporangium aridum]SMD18557.1 Hemerythrin HHE cation binding domain-containing protein [Kibdelosporangium aridum]